MRSKTTAKLESLRKRHPVLGESPVGENFGYFETGPLRIISSGSGHGDPWEHVSVSCCDRCPTWDEMATVKELFWGDDETVVQFHPRKSAYVNCHPYCLHLWKRHDKEYELPPRSTLA